MPFQNHDWLNISLQFINSTEKVFTLELDRRTMYYATHSWRSLCEQVLYQ